MVSLSNVAPLGLPTKTCNNLYDLAGNQKYGSFFCRPIFILTSYCLSYGLNFAYFFKHKYRDQNRIGNQLSHKKTFTLQGVVCPVFDHFFKGYSKCW